MTTYCVGCDNIVGGESNIINKVAKVLEKAGHTCERLSVGPNHVQSKGLSSSSKGKVAVFLVGGSDIGTYVDFKMGLERGYYHYKYMWFAFCSWTASTWITEKELKNRPLVRAHDDNFSRQSDIAPYLGKSADSFFQQNKQKMNYVYGQSPEELAKKILGGGSDSADGDSKESNGGTIKEALQKLLSHWDGEAECYIRGDKMYVHKVRDPETYHSSILQEGVNIFADSVTVTDVNPNTVNYLTVLWSGGRIVMTDEALISRFGNVRRTVRAVKKILVKETVSSEEDSDGEDTEGTTGAGGDTDYTNSTTGRARIDQMIDKSNSSSGSDGSSDSSGDSSSSSSDGSTETKTTVKEIPITNYKDALKFARTYWNKLQRDNGRTLECQVYGSCNWKNGEWCRVFLPSFDIDGYMYITRTSQSLDGGDWTNNLSLVDFPPGWGAEVLESDDSSGSSEDSSSSSGDSSSSSSDSSSGDGSSGSSAKDSKSKHQDTSTTGRTRIEQLLK